MCLQHSAPGSVEEGILFKVTHTHFNSPRKRKKKLIIFENSNSQSRGALHEAEYMIKLLVQKQELEGRQDAQDMLRMQQQVQQQQQMQQQQVDKRFEEVQDEEEDSDDDDDFDLGDTQVVDDLLNSFAPKD